MFEISLTIITHCYIYIQTSNKLDMLKHDILISIYLYYVIAKLRRTPERMIYGDGVLTIEGSGFWVVLKLTAPSRQNAVN